MAPRACARYTYSNLSALHLYCMRVRIVSVFYPPYGPPVTDCTTPVCIPFGAWEVQCRVTCTGAASGAKMQNARRRTVASSCARAWRGGFPSTSHFLARRQLARLAASPTALPPHFPLPPLPSLHDLSPVSSRPPSATMSHSLADLSISYQISPPRPPAQAHNQHRSNLRRPLLSLHVLLLCWF
jgi:hypothetical protein